MINNKVYRLKKETKLDHGLSFPAGQEFEIVMDVVYMGGFPLPVEFQAMIYGWIKNNPTLFIDDTRNF